MEETLREFERSLEILELDLENSSNPSAIVESKRAKLEYVEMKLENYLTSIRGIIDVYGPKRKGYNTDLASFQEDHNSQTSVAFMPMNWNELDAISKVVRDSDSSEELLFGCFRLSRAVLTDLRERGYELEEIDYRKVLQDPEKQDQYLNAVEKQLGLTE